MSQITNYVINITITSFGCTITSTRKLPPGLTKTSSKLSEIKLEGGVNFCVLFRDGGASVTQTPKLQNAWIGFSFAKIKLPGYNLCDG